MLSHVIEYACQYTDQIRKKNKVWHDGKLKYFQINNKFQLFTEEGNIMIGTEFITNKKEVADIINREGFNTTEHKIFRQYIVIISEAIQEYDREIQITAKAKDMPQTRLNHSDTGNTLNKQVPRGNSSQQNLKVNSTVVRSSLALKINKPFKKPRMINTSESILTTSQSLKNRPSIRTNKLNSRNVLAVTKYEVSNIPDGKSVNNASCKIPTAEIINNEDSQKIRKDAVNIRKMVNRIFPEIEKPIIDSQKTNDSNLVDSNTIDNSRNNHIRSFNHQLLLGKEDHSITPELSATSILGVSSNKRLSNTKNAIDANIKGKNVSKPPIEKKRVLGKTRNKIRVVDHKPIII